MRAQFSNAGSAFDLAADSFDEEGDERRPPRIMRQPSQKAAPMARSGSFRSEIPLQRGSSTKFRDIVTSDVEENEVFCPPPMSRQPSTRVPLFRSGSFNKPPPLVRENSLLGDVRTRLHKLIADQQMEELETRFTQEQERLQRLLLQAEIQKVVTKKVKELNTIEESQSISSRLTARSRGVRTAGQDSAHRSSAHSPHPVMHRAFTTGSTVHPDRHHHYRENSKSPPTIRQGASSPTLGKQGTISPSSHRSKSPPVAHVTIPSAHVSSLSSAEKFNKTHAGDSVYHNHHNNHKYDTHLDDDLNDDVSDLGSQYSQGSLGSLSTNKRHALIIIRKTDINHREIRAIVNEKLPSPEKWAIEEQYTSPAFPALLRTSPKKPPNASATVVQKEPPEKYSANGAPMSFRSVVSAVSSKNNALSGKSGENSTFSSTKSPSLSEKADTLGTMYSAKVEKVSTNNESAKRPAPAPFMKTKSSSSIMLTQVAPAPLTAAETGGVPVIPVRRLSVANMRTKGAVAVPLRSSLRSSQLFSLNASEAYLGELQSEDILASHYRGWTPSVLTLSSKNNSSHTNFY